MPTPLPVERFDVFSELGALVALPETDVRTLAESPVAMANRVVSLERTNRQLTWFVLGLAFVVWIMIQGRR